MAVVQCKTTQVDTVKIFYREAGSTKLPNLLLLHGHASSSHTFRNIIPTLAESFHVVAPDYPGFGNSDRPTPKDYEYNFVNLADTIYKFTEKVGLKKFNVYLFDFGAPVGLLMAEKHPECIAGIFSQSGNVYDEGLSPAFDMIKAFWANPNDQGNVKKVGHIFSAEGLAGAYTHGVQHPENIAPDAPNLDIYYTSRPGAADIQMELLRDYENNVKKYPRWQEWIRQHKPKIVAVWGKNDPFFASPGAEAFKRDAPEADVSIIDAGHFLNESNPQEIIAGLKKLL